MSDSKADTRDRLILVATKLFSEKGFKGVSMRTINSAAGSRNSSAVHYHFGSKKGIIAAVIERLHNEIEPLLSRIIDDLEVKKQVDVLYVEDIVMAVSLPFWALYNIPDYGRHAAILTARLIQEGDQNIKDLYSNNLKEPMGRLRELLKTLQPEKDDLHLRYQLTKCLVTAIMGIATIDYMNQTSLGDIRFHKPADLMHYHAMHMTYGLGIPKMEKRDSKLDVNFWSRYNAYLAKRPSSEERTSGDSESEHISNAEKTAVQAWSERGYGLESA